MLYLSYVDLYCIAARWRRDNWEIKLMEQPDEHYSLVGGNLVITNPRQKKHGGTYVCVAKNIYGTVISKEARVKFGCEHVVQLMLAFLGVLILFLAQTSHGSGRVRY